ncbi:carbohydrate ABC transporter permease [Treponema zuelzerae]|uniref:Carbohydrate ABC transporter permease n=1 Tax=Teretinema zuelzerae TaxID=156 RepID=A0AAE3JI02_9SPIR|nr:carbohydrate ABC transporter permease [Teretinema zuelzerae]MBN2811082.1 carbohydrate ABC transporter permease [Spirochaetales bacterium]MCD1653668.1 carbohydrate ABC transporter permease [Teretinema zuelzerae]
MKSYTAGLMLKRTLVYGIMITLFILAIVPIWLLLINATRSTEQINAGISMLPGSFKQVAYNWNALTSRGFSITQGFYNSLYLAFWMTLCGVYFSAMTAYGLHVYRFVGRRFLWGLILLIMMLPGSLSFIGFYQFMARIKLTDNYLALIIPTIASAGTVLFLRQYLQSILSMELIDAARIDGAGEFRTFHTIVIPIVTPALAAQSIFSFVGSWNNFFTPFVLISTESKATLPMLVQKLRGDIYRTEYGGIYLGIAVSIVPILIFYSFMSRFIISGITLGGVKE